MCSFVWQLQLLVNKYTIVNVTTGGRKGDGWRLGCLWHTSAVQWWPNMFLLHTLTVLSSKGEFVMLYTVFLPQLWLEKPVPAPCFLSVHIHSDKPVLVLSSSKTQTSLTGKSASSKSRGGSGMWGSKLLRRRHGDSSEKMMVVTGCWHVTLPDAFPAEKGVLACGCDWAVAAGSWSARCPRPGCERVPHVTAAPRSG